MSLTSHITRNRSHTFELSHEALSIISYALEQIRLLDNYYYVLGSLENSKSLQVMPYSLLRYKLFCQNILITLLC